MKLAKFNRNGVRNRHGTQLNNYIGQGCDTYGEGLHRSNWMRKEERGKRKGKSSPKQTGH